MDQSHIYQILVAAVEAAKMCADGELRKVFEDEFCIVWQDGSRQVTLGKGGDVYVRCGNFAGSCFDGQGKGEGEGEKIVRLPGEGKREVGVDGSGQDMENFNFDRPTRESYCPSPNSFNVRWLRGHKSELERVNSIESLLFTCNSNIKL